jgi:hypothetical protein
MEAYCASEAEGNALLAEAVRCTKKRKTITV